MLHGKDKAPLTQSKRPLLLGTLIYGRGGTGDTSLGDGVGDNFVIGWQLAGSPLGSNPLGASAFQLLRRQLRRGIHKQQEP